MEPQETRTGKNKLKLKWKLLWLIPAGLLVALLLFCASLYSAWKTPANAFLEEAMAMSSSIVVPEGIPLVDEYEKEIEPIASPMPTESHTEFQNANVVNVLLLGIDSNEQRQEEHKGWRSDMVMLCTLDFNDNVISLTSIPRDTQTVVYHVDENGEATKSQLTKINHAYSYGGGPDKYGAQNAMLAVGDYLSNASGMKIPISYYVSIDLENVPKLADDMGGIPVTLDVDFPGIGKKGDVVVLNSVNANKFLQNRYDVGGDIVRTRHHKDFLFSLIGKIKKQGAVESAPTLFSLATKYVKTNLSLQQIVALGSVLDNSDLGNMDYKVIEGDFNIIDGVCYYISNPEDVKNRVEMIMQ